MSLYYGERLYGDTLDLCFRWEDVAKAASIAFDTLFQFRSGGNTLSCPSAVSTVQVPLQSVERERSLITHSPKRCSASSSVPLDRPKCRCGQLHAVPLLFLYFSDAAEAQVAKGKSVVDLSEQGLMSKGNRAAEPTRLRDEVCDECGELKRNVPEEPERYWSAMEDANKCSSAVRTTSVPL